MSSTFLHLHYIYIYISLELKNEGARDSQLD